MKPERAEDVRQMKKKKINLSLFIGIVVTVFLISVMSVSAATTIISPAASTGIINGTVIFNVTVSDLDNEADGNSTLLNITFWAKSTLTGNSSWTFLAENSSINLSLLHADFEDKAYNVTGTTITNIADLLEDANNYIFNVSVYNGTEGQLFSDDTNIGIIVDNTIPTASTSLIPTTDEDGDVTFSGTVDGAKTTSCNLVFANNGPTFGSRTQAMTHTGNTCSLSLTAVPEHTYIWYITASDESNTTDSSTQTTTVDVSTGGGYNPPTLGITSDVIDAGGVPIALIILVVVIVTIVWLVRRK